MQDLHTLIMSDARREISLRIVAAIATGVSLALLTMAVHAAPAPRTETCALRPFDHAVVGKDVLQHSATRAAMMTLTEGTGHD
jgi:hypothetical protein